MNMFNVGVFKKRQPVYLAGRLIRQVLPESLALRFLSRRAITPEQLYKQTTRNYLRGIMEGGLQGLFAADAPLTLLEAGTGFYNPASAPLLLSGAARLILLEPFLGDSPDYARFRERFDRLLQAACADPAYMLPKGAPPPSSESGTLPSSVEISTHYWEDTQLPSASVDGIFSSSVLEHLREPDAVLRECARIVRPGGFMVNVVDMRDHFFRYPLEMLKYSKTSWERLTTSSGGSGFQNRRRVGQWLTALAGQGFESVVLPVLECPEVAAAERPYLDAEFRDIPQADLGMFIAILVSRRV